jgi:hypothetical protein
MVIKQPTVVLATGRTMSGGMKSQERVFPVLVEILFQAHVPCISIVGDLLDILIGARSFVFQGDSEYGPVLLIPYRS